MYRFWLPIVIFFLATANFARADSKEPLERLLYRIPIEAAGSVSLSDLNAARAQIASIATETAQSVLDLLPFAVIYPKLGFDVIGVRHGDYEDGAQKKLGFSVFEIDQIAGWSNNSPEATVIATGISERSAEIEAALLARKFAAAKYQGHTVWHRHDDFALGRSGVKEEPFSGLLGTSERFSIDAQYLLFTRDWLSMRRLLDSSSSLADDLDASAILNAGYSMSEFGALVDTVLIAGQPIMPKDKTQTDEATSARHQLPPFNRYGLMHWMDGTLLTVAIVIPYAESETASIAQDQLAARLGATVAPSANRLFAELLPSTQSYKIASTSNRHVLIASFQQRIEITSPLSVATLDYGTPYWRLIGLLERGDLDVLLGKAP